MKNTSLLILVFAFLSVFFFLLLIFVRIPFPLYPLMSYQDAIDILTPLVLIPIYWQLYKVVTRGRTAPAGEMAFMVMAAFWAAGQGLHLSANSIDNLIENLARKQIVDVSATDIYHLTYSYDEYLGHFLWHIGVLGLAGLLIYESWRQPAEEQIDWRLIVPASTLYGFLLFCIFVEGNTLPMGLPFISVVTALILIAGRQKLSRQPVLAFFFLSFVVALLFLAAWGLYWGCFPPIMHPQHC